MEKTIGKNVSSGAEKVEAAEKRVPSTGEKKKKASPRKTAQKRAETQEKKAAAVRLEKAKKKAKAKEEKATRRAEWKREKLEKKAKLKEKRAEHRAEIARKRAERKQAKIDRRAALKEKKIERRAERIARREMLKNETRAEREKRIEREKREKAALREKKMEEKHAARLAAHERKAKDRQHRREQKTARKRDRRGFGGWLAAVVSLGVACLALGTVVAAGAFRMNDMALEAESGARASLYELVSVAEDMDGSLSKLRVSAGVEEQRKLLTEVLVNSALMESVLERIPVDAATGTDVSAFVNETGRYAKDMLARLASGKTLTGEQHEQILKLYAVNTKLYGELNDLVMKTSSGELRDFFAGKEGTMSEKFEGIGGAMHEEIADAPFSGHGNIGENKLASLKEVTREEAEAAAKEYFEGYHVQTISYTGETNALGVTCYNFVLTDENGAEIFTQITKNGGKLAFFDSFEECTQKNFDLESCVSLAKEYLAGLGVKDAEAVWVSDGGMVASLTFVPTENGVRIYPEAIRIRVCESKGRVLGLDAMQYLLNDEEGTGTAGISEDEARGLLLEDLDVTGVNLAVIPSEGRRALCYEFDCMYGEEEYIIYLDADTGAELQVYRVRKSAQGNYLD